jgi:protein ImuB
VPERWSSKAELCAETSEISILIETIDKILDGLVEKLRKHQSQVQSLNVSFEHMHRHPTVEHFDLIEPSHQKDRLLNLIGDRLERIVLPVPAIAVSLSADSLWPMHLKDPELFASASEEASRSVLIERLRGRFGVAGVYGVGLVAEHRPEYAWSKVVHGLIESSSDIPAASPWARRRPLWVLPLPLPLSSSAARFYNVGSLQLRSDPERIESGWWDDEDVSRDYYTAVGARGQKLWIYQDRVSAHWYLHGIFG